MRLNLCYTLMLVLMEHVHDAQPFKNETLNNIKNIGNRLEQKLSSFLEDKMGDLLKEKMSGLEQKMSILTENMKDHEDKMKQLFEDKMFEFKKKITDHEKKMPNHLKNRISDLLSEYQGMKNTTENFPEFNTSSVPEIDENIEKCPEDEGFFVVPGGYQCLKTFHDQWRNWTEADDKCKSEGLALAKPDDTVAVALRKYIVENLGDGWHTWVGGRRYGSNMQWVRDNSTLRSDNGLWQPWLQGHNLTTDHCLGLATTNYWLAKHPNLTYVSIKCSSEIYTLCERIIAPVATIPAPTTPGTTTPTPTTPTPTTTVTTTTASTTPVTTIPLSTTTDNPNCPKAEGFFLEPRSGQCFKFFKDQKLVWKRANTKCTSENLVLAKPKEAIEVRKYIVEELASDVNTWIGAKATGSTMTWVRDQEELPVNSPLLFKDTSSGGFTNKHCLALLTMQSFLDHDSSSKNSPFKAAFCERESYYTLCEKIL